MTELLTAAQMRAIEQAAIASGEVTGLELMERAGQGVVDAIFAEWPELAPGAEREASPSRSPGYKEKQRSKERRAVVLCGPGNNGGDGFVVARLLHKAGWAVEVFLYGDAAKLPPDARVNYERWREMGEVETRAIDAPPFADDSFHIGNVDLIVDGLFGTGLKRPLDGPFALLALARERMETWSVPIVAIDIPTGLCADSGAILRQAIRSDLTVTFHRQKLGHLLNCGPNLCGKVRLVDIGLDEGALSDHRPAMQLPCAEKTRILLSKDRGHKYSHGHALILSGGVGKGGAARLAARGALRIGAGAVTIGCPPAALIENATQLNAIMLRKVADAAALDAVLEDARINALCLGPGLGLGAREAELVAAGLSRDKSQPTDSAVGRGSPRRPVVLDADALTLLARDEALIARLHDRCVLTPHAGEFRRLFPDIAERLEVPATTGPAYSKVDATREAAKRAGCVVLFKGPDTVIAAPDGRCSINASVYERAAPWLATAGSGDVLAGFITGLLARGFAPMQAAETGAWLHTECARHFGPGLIAEDLPEELPKVFRALGIA